jgi:hypothetical protein
MALQPKISISNAGDCGTLYINDITGAYDASSNPGGYGAPNTTLANVVTVNATIQFFAPDGSPVVTYSNIPLYPTTANPFPFLLNEVYAITPAILGLPAGTATLPDGLYIVTYNVIDTIPATYTGTSQYLFDCNARCCISNKLAAIDPCGCDCKDTETLFKYSMFLDAAEAAIGCNQNKKGLDLLNAVENYCLNNDCGCGD